MGGEDISHGACRCPFGRHDDLNVKNEVNPIGPEGGRCLASYRNSQKTTEFGTKGMKRRETGK